MSVFGDGTEQSQTDTQQSDTATETKDSFLQKLVEQRGQQWSDPEVIAKGKIEADRHIENLERQLAEMREDLNKQDYSKKLLDTLQNKAGNLSPEPVDANNNEGPDAQNTTGAEGVDLESLVEATLQKREQKATVAQNVAMVEEALASAYGTEAQKVVVQKSQELGLSMDRMKELAEESPQAFLNMLGQAPARERNADLDSSMNTAGFKAGTKRNWKFYQDMRRSDPKTYYSPAVQNEIAKAHVEQGDSFYS